MTKSETKTKMKKTAEKNDEENTHEILKFKGKKSIFHQQGWMDHRAHHIKNEEKRSKKGRFCIFNGVNAK